MKEMAGFIIPGSISCVNSQSCKYVITHCSEEITVLWLMSEDLIHSSKEVDECQWVRKDAKPLWGCQEIVVYASD